MKKSLLQQHGFKLFIGCYFLILAAFMLNAALCPDGYYYWNWSEHLQLSYYDGSPLVAYVMALLTWAFGYHEFSIYLLGLISAALTAVFIYCCSLLFFSITTARLATCLWLLSPGIIRYFFFQTTYNSVLIIFWASTIYYLCKLIQEKHVRYFYACGVSIGLMLLAKYTGALLCLALLIMCLAYARYRFILKSYHFYLGLIIGFLIFSPVLIWNHQHQWVSFLYQLHHGYAGQNPGIIKQLSIYLGGNLLDYSVVFLALIYFGFKYRAKLFTHPYAIFTIPTLFIWLFFLVSSGFSVPQTNWNAPVFFSGILLLAALIELKPIKKYWLIGGCVILAAASFMYVLGSRFPYFYLGSGPGWSQVYASKAMLKTINPKNYANKIIFTNDYQLTSYAHRFLNDRPSVYSDKNQYQLWWQQALPKLNRNKILYLSYKPIGKNTTYFKDCTSILVEQYTQERLLHKPYVWTLYGYECVLKNSL